MLNFALSKFEVKNESNKKFIENLVDTLRNKVYDSESFDEHLDYQEYLVLRDISKQLLMIKGGGKCEKLEAQI